MESNLWRHNGGADEFSGLRFAVYARKSNEDARHEDHRSIARQIEQARRYVEAKGGEVLPECVYQDDAVSGAEFKNRAGLIRFLDTLKNGKPFNAVVMSEESRLGREQVETAYILKQITDAVVRVFYYMEGREARLDSAMDKIMASLTLFGAELEREKARQRARDAAERKARQGFVTGKSAFGYRNVRMKGDRPAGPGEQHDYVIRQIDEQEATAVRGMFQMFADGYGRQAIAKAMNADPAHAEHTRRYFNGRRVPTPRASTGAWGPTAIGHTLDRDIYRGVVTWGKTTHVDKGGRAGIAVKSDRDPITMRMPNLQIIPDNILEVVQRRRQAAREAYCRDPHGRLFGKPDRPDLRGEGGYLLSGLAQCGLCTSNIIVLGGRKRAYGCSRNHLRGACVNDLRQPVTLVDSVFLGTLQREVLTPERFRYAVEVAIERVRERLAQDPDCRPALEREKVELMRKIKHLVAAIGDGRGPAALVQEIAKAETRLKEIDGELTRLETAPSLTSLNLKRLEQEIEGELCRFADLLKGNVPPRPARAQKAAGGPDRIYAHRRGRTAAGLSIRRPAHLWGSPPRHEPFFARIRGEGAEYVQRFVFYDVFSGLPMLWNPATGKLDSVDALLTSQCRFQPQICTGIGRLVGSPIDKRPSREPKVIVLLWHHIHGLISAFPLYNDHCPVNAHSSRIVLVHPTPFEPHMSPLESRIIAIIRRPDHSNTVLTTGQPEFIL